ncbi:MAG: hypothetical protein AABW91_01310 [Nanoarchaeota archaeon]
MTWYNFWKGMQNRMPATRNGAVKRQRKYFSELEKEEKERVQENAIVSLEKLAKDLDFVFTFKRDATMYFDLPYKVPKGNEIPKVCGERVIIFEPASRCQEIFEHYNFEMYEFHIAEGANSSGGVDREIEKYCLTLTSKENQKWTSYNEFVEAYKEKFKDKNLETIRGELVDYVLLNGIVHPSKQPVSIEMGVLPYVERNIFERIYRAVVPESILRKVYKLSPGMIKGRKLIMPVNK